MLHDQRIKDRAGGCIAELQSLCIITGLSPGQPTELKERYAASRQYELGYYLGTVNA